MRLPWTRNIHFNPTHERCCPTTSCLTPTQPRNMARGMSSALGRARSVLFRHGGPFLLGLLLPPALLFGCGGGAPSAAAISPVRSLAFSGDGKWLGAGRGSITDSPARPWRGVGEMKVWQVSNWEPWLGGHTGY